jgi:hypothetical protein
MSNLKVNLYAILVIMLALFKISTFADSLEEDVMFLKKEIAKIKSSGIVGSQRESSLGDIKIDGYGTFVVQATPKVNKESHKKSINGSFEYGVYLTKEVSVDAKVYMHVKGATGYGLNDKLHLYSNLNAAASTTNSDLKILEFLYEQSLRNKKFKLTLGELNPTRYFDCNIVANDETRQFLASMFVNNPAIAFPSYSLGLKIEYLPSDDIGFAYGYFNANEEWNNMDVNNFNIIEADFKMLETGNYRLMCWKNFGDSGIYGLGINFDQSVHEDITLFTRYAYQNNSNQYDEASFVASNSWSFGAQFSGGLWHRKQDKVGIALGQIFPLKEWIKHKKYSNTEETQIEVYYSLRVNDNIAVYPIAQYVAKPYGGNIITDEAIEVTNDKNIFAFTLRTNITF